jgi:flagellar basal body-associated protein FliL
MSHHDPDDDEPTEAERRRSNLILLIVSVVVVVLGVYLVNWLIEQRKLQECLESGRHNCAPITTPSR